MANRCACGTLKQIGFEEFADLAGRNCHREAREEDEQTFDPGQAYLETFKIVLPFEETTGIVKQRQAQNERQVLPTKIDQGCEHVR